MSVVPISTRNSFSVIAATLPRQHLAALVLTTATANQT
jgi:hypothetical protein